jgi:RNA polymerase sigma-70 factor, ECF subfamily
MTSTTDADLVRRLVAGDATALEDVYAFHSGRCNGIAYRILGNDEAAHDAVQEAFLSLWRHRQGLVIRTAGIGPWLFVVTRNAALTIHRREAAREKREDSLAVLAAGSDADPAVVVASNAASSALQKAVDQLTPEQREVIQLAYFKWMTLTQIAARTNTPLGTVKRRAQLAVRRLGALLAAKQAGVEEL